MFRNRFVQILAGITIIIWGNALFQVVKGGSGKNINTAQISKTSEMLPELTIFNRTPIVFDSTIRDPFRSYLYSKKPVNKSARNKVNKPVKNKPIVEVKPPDVKIKSILWGPSPMVILEKNGKTQILKKGSKAWGLKVKSISKSGAVVIKEGKEFKLSQ